MSELLEAAKVLGVAGPARKFTAIRYLSLVDRGLPIKSLDLIANAISPSDASFKYRIVPKATLARLKFRRKLNAAQGIVVTRLADIWSSALRVWKSDDEARDFLYRRHPLLDDQRPIDLVLENEIGAELVRSILGRLEYGSAV
jgi:putative toxin-antitoxin system antitoxin component (TIGR02293 family)